MRRKRPKGGRTTLREVVEELGRRGYQALLVAEAKAQNAEAEARHRALLIEQMKFTIAKLRHEKFGQSSCARRHGRGRLGGGILSNSVI